MAGLKNFLTVVKANRIFLLQHAS